MKKSTITTGYSNLEVLNKLDLNINVSENKYDIPLEFLFKVAARKNPKRNFLFVSKLLGKHIPVHPEIPRISGVLLSDLFMNKIIGSSPYDSRVFADVIINQNNIELAIKEINKHKIKLDTETLFIGFAETATGLGHAMYSAFSEGASFIHTTREDLVNLKSSFNFEEEHSHATSHRCYSLEDNYFNRFSRIVLVDDEITTGKTSLNLIRALNKHFPNKEYIMASILDWRSEAEIQAYRYAEKELGVKITEISLVSGQVDYNHNIVEFEETFSNKVQDNKILYDTVKLPVSSNLTFDFTSRDCSDNLLKKSYYKLTGRFGLNSSLNEKLEEDINKFSEILKPYRKYNDCLCIGYGEYIYIPSRISSLLGDNILYQSITRSPIYSIDKEDYPIRNSIPFKNPEDKSVMNFIYNITPNKYEEIFMFLERDIEIETKQFIASKFEQLGVKSLIFAVLN